MRSFWVAGPGRIWAAFWPTAPDDAAVLRDHLNRLPKYVVSRTLQRADWEHSTIISGDIATGVAKLKAQPGGELVVYGSADIVDSTGRAADMGDRAWRALPDRYVDIVRAEVQRWMGQNLELTGDGVMATFETPTRALRCAFGLAEAVQDLGIQLRAGLHTGEIERREGGIGGIAVHIAARVMGLADPGQVMATRTVRDLATGTDLAFEARGSEALRGVPGTWELFAVTSR